jgi:hypothetical protein
MQMYDEIRIQPLGNMFEVAGYWHYSGHSESVCLETFKRKEDAINWAQERYKGHVINKTHEEILGFANYRTA